MNATPTTPELSEEQVKAALASTLDSVRDMATTRVENTIKLSRTHQWRLQELMRTHHVQDMLDNMSVDKLPAIEAFVQHPDFTSAPLEVQNYLKEEIRIRLSAVLMTEWADKSRGYMGRSQDNSLWLPEIKQLLVDMASHLANRKEIAVMPTQFEGEFVDTIEVLRKRYDQLQMALDTELTDRFNRLLADLSLQLDRTVFSEHIVGVYNTDIYRALRNLLPNMSQSVSERLEQELKDMVNARLDVLAQKEKAERDRIQAEQAGHIRQSKDLSETILRSVGLQTTADGIETVEKGDMMRVFRESLQKIDSISERDGISAGLKSKIDAAKSRLKIATVSGGYVDIGDGIKFRLFYPEPPKPLRWEIKTKPPKDGMIDIYFEAREQGKAHEDAEVLGRINPHGGVDNGQNVRQVWHDRYPLRVPEAEFREMMRYVTRGPKKTRSMMGLAEKIPNALRLDASEDEIKAYRGTTTDEQKHATKYGYLARILAWLPKHNTSERSKVPNIPSTAIMGPSTKEFLREFSDLADIQLDSLAEGNGITIIEGDAGTGKNYKINIYASLTNREVFEMSGNRTATKSDMLFTHEIGPDGTYRASTELIRGMQTPGAIIVLDEVNAYPPEVLKLLNPLLTGGRYINDPIRGKIRCHPSVIICGAMNPSHYIGTAPLPQEIKSRGRIIRDSYPAPYLADRTISWEEPLLLSRHAKKSGLADMKEEEFIENWKRRQRTASSHPASTASEKMLSMLTRYVKFAAKMRELYSDTCSGKDGVVDELHYSLSLRDGIQIVYEHERTGSVDFKQAVLKVLIPKLAAKAIDIAKEEELVREKANEFFS